MTVEDLAEITAFWDDFATDYTTIQEESKLPIVADLKHFLLTKKMLPCQTFLDLAGGSGKYLSLQTEVDHYTLVDISAAMLKLAQPQASDKVQLIQADQQTFFQQQETFDIVFSAMNPALTVADLPQLLKLAKKYCLILRVVTEEDRMFSPYEAKNPQLNWNQAYKDWLLQEKISFTTQLFTYETTEETDLSFYQAYFAEVPQLQLEKRIQQLFGAASKQTNREKVEFECILIRRS